MGQKNSSNKGYEDGKSHSTAGDDSDGSENQERKSPAVSANYRDIILECFGNASSVTATRILMRIGQQRSDFKVYKDNLTHEEFGFLTDLMSKYLCEVIENINDADKVKELSMNYGSKHVSLRLKGFRPDFFAAMADAIATECSFLNDSPTARTPTNTFKAWTLLVGLMFSSVRDGYYKELRRQRRQSPSYLKSSRDSSTSLEHLAAAHPDFKQWDSATSESSRSGAGEFADNDKTITASAKPSFKLISRAGGSEESDGGHQAGSLGEDRNAETKGCADEPVTEPKRIQRYHKSKSTSSFSKLLSSSAPKSSDDYHHSHMERLMNAMKARTPTSCSNDEPLVGRFLKNPAALADYESKRRHRIEEIIRHRSPKHLPSKPATPVTPTFDPNKIIDDFMNDRYKV